MLTKEKYIILEDIPKNLNLSTELCIINYNILPTITETNNLIKQNPTTTFWIATNNYSKDFVKTISKLGIQNIIPIPIKKELIDDFFNTKLHSQKNETLTQEFTQLKNSKILIVDDNELNIKLLKEVLSNLGIQITTCLNPISALELIKDEKFDLFLLDILMPAISGFELAEEIKKSTINSISPIIFISAISGTENIINGYNLGACSYIEKPFNPNIVKSQIYNILKVEEEKKILEKEKENFVATLTHDLKSPINAEINALQYLLKKCPNDIKHLQNELLSELLNSAKYMKQITDKILCHYKQKNNKISLHKETVSFSALIASSIEELKYLANEKNLKIQYKTNIENDFVTVDILEMKRVFNNIISNAIEYSEQNGRIDISLEINNNKFICKVKDNGIGIDLTNIGNVFDEYITFAKKFKKTGFGLGLNICKKIINLHNGEISMHSEPQKGTLIQFTLPA